MPYDEQQLHKNKAAMQYSEYDDKRIRCKDWCCIRQQEQHWLRGKRPAKVNPRLWATLGSYARPQCTLSCPPASAVLPTRAVKVLLRGKLRSQSQNSHPLQAKLEILGTCNRELEISHGHRTNLKWGRESKQGWQRDYDWKIELHRRYVRIITQQKQ